MTRVGVISDTHGLLRPQAVAAFDGVDHIVHAGDIGSPQVVDELSRVAPVRAVRGNVDREPWAQAYPLTASFEVGGVACYLLHELAALDIDPVRDGVRVVISGHSHKPVAQWRDEVLNLNPGSAGPRRFSLPICVGVLEIGKVGIAYQHIDLLP